MEREGHRMNHKDFTNLDIDIVPSIKYFPK